MFCSFDTAVSKPSNGRFVVVQLHLSSKYLFDRPFQKVAKLRTSTYYSDEELFVYDSLHWPRIDG